MSKAPCAPASWPHALAFARLAPRCGARCKRTGLACLGPAMRNGRCRMHGGPSTGARSPEGVARCAAAPLKHGRRNAAARARAAERRQARVAVAELRRLTALIKPEPGDAA